MRWWIWGLALSLVVGCTGEMEETGGESWTLIADGAGALRDPRYPELNGYPNSRLSDQLNISITDRGICGTDAYGERCGGPIQGIPYNIRVAIRGSRTFARIVDIFGNQIGPERTGGQAQMLLEAAGVDPDSGYGATPTDGMPTGCTEVTAPGGQACTLCLNEAGMVMSNSCKPGDGAGVAPDGQPAPEPGGGVIDCSTPEGAAQIAADMFVDSINESFAEMGIPVELPPADVSQLVNFDEGDIGSGRSQCLAVLEYLEDEFSDDGPGQSDYVFSQEAIDECMNEGSCRIGQLVTRTMAEVCAQIPPGCDLPGFEDGIVGCGGYAVGELCPDDDDDGDSDSDSDSDGHTHTATCGCPDAVVEAPPSPIEECRGSPLVLDLARDGLALAGMSVDRTFPLVSNEAMSVGWLEGTDDAFLAVDLDGDGAISSGRELFGEATGGWAADGFSALSREDSNNDGVINEDDPIFEQLVAWVDDGDAKSEPGELLPLTSLGLSSIALSNTRVGTKDAFGNELGLEGAAESADGDSIPVVDVWFRVGR